MSVMKERDRKRPLSDAFFLSDSSQPNEEDEVEVNDFTSLGLIKV